MPTINLGGSGGGGGGISLNDVPIGVGGVWTVASDASAPGTVWLNSGGGSPSTISGSWSSYGSTGFNFQANVIDALGYDRTQELAMIRNGIDYFLVWKDKSNYGFSQCGFKDFSGNPVMIVGLQSIPAGAHGNIPGLGDTVRFELFYSDLQDLSPYATTSAMNTAIAAAISSITPAGSPYTAGNSADWFNGIPPTNIQDALDRLAAAFTANTLTLP